MRWNSARQHTTKFFLRSIDAIPPLANNFSFLAAFLAQADPPADSLSVCLSRPGRAVGEHNGTRSGLLGSLQHGREARMISLLNLLQHAENSW